MGETSRVADESKKSLEASVDPLADVPAEESDGSVDDALALIHARAEAVRDEQVERAVARLAGDDELPPERRAAVERLADRLVERLVAMPAATLEAAEDGGPADREAVLDLFGDDCD